MSVQESVLEIIAEQAVLKISDIQPTATLEELGIDSLGLVEAVFAIEEKFGIEVPFNASENGASGFDVTSVGSIIVAVETLIANK